MSVVGTQLEQDIVEVQELTKFKNDCLDLGEEIVVQKHLIDGSSYFFQLYYDDHEEFSFKKALASSLNVHIRDVAIVGSGKLGFSIKPDKKIPGFYPFKIFDHDYDLDSEKKKSDLDIAIVSSTLFDRQLLSLYEHTDCYMGSVFKNKMKNDFAGYVLKGWIRPDMLPNSYNISPTIDEVRNNFRTKYNRDVNIGIYKSWKYFETYHINNVRNIALNLIA